MITQAIKEWLQKLFAWWPWKQSAAVEYEQVTSSTVYGTPEASLWISQEETTSQAGTTPPRRFLLDSRERLLPQRPEIADVPPHTRQTPALQASADLSPEPDELSADAPTPRQRLEFLRYLVQHGIINEGQEDYSPLPPTK